MKKTPDNLNICTVVFVVSLVISNITASKIFTVGASLFGSEIAVPCAVFCYPVTFLMTDIIGEIWSKREANRAVFLGFIGQALASLMITAAGALPSSDPVFKSAWSAVLGQSWVFTVGSLTAYFASQYCDVCVFHSIRERMLNADHSRSARWIWNNMSTMTSQLIDTAVFISISFGLGFGWFFSPETRGALFAMMAGQYIIKFLFALADTPIFMLLTIDRSSSKDEKREQTQS